MISKRVFDTLKDGRKVICYKIENSKGAYAEILDFGGIVRSICVPDRDGNLTDVTVGFDRMGSYRKFAGAFFGAAVGRYANRIGKARFTLNGQVYNIAKNEGENHLHGGFDCYSYRIWEIRKETSDSLTLRMVSPDGDEGFPGNLTLDLKYTFTEDNVLKIEYDAKSDKDTVFNPTNHSYFNLNGFKEDEEKNSVLGNKLKIDAEYYTPINRESIPTGEVRKVSGPMDFTGWKAVGDGLTDEENDEDLIAGTGYDHNFIHKNEFDCTVEPIAWLYGPETGILMETRTNMPGVQLYTGNFMQSGTIGKNGVSYGKRNALCLETQFYPDSPNRPEWPSPVLKAGEKCHYVTEYAFSIGAETIILDGYTSNHGDLSWKELEKCGPLTVYDRTPAPLTQARCMNADAVITNKTLMTEEIINNLPRLKYIGLLSTGANAVCIPAARERKIAVTNVPGYSTEDVAQMTFALILELMLHVGNHSALVKSGMWEDSKDFCFWNFPLIELNGKTLGIIGFGSIGKRVCDIALAFGMKVIVNTRTPRPLPEGVEAVSKEELFAKADIVTLHCPLTDDNANLICSETISMMKDGAYIINTARGGLVDEKALAAALNSGKIAGAGVDVLSSEPPKKNNPLVEAKNCIITPHISWAAYSARIRLISQVAKNLAGFLNGEKINRLD